MTTIVDRQVKVLQIAAFDVNLKQRDLEQTLARTNSNPY